MNKKNFKLKSGDYNLINSKIDNNPIANVDYENDEHYYFIFASIKLGIEINDLQRCINRFKELEKFISDYETIYGKDARAKIHKDLILEVRDEKFNFNTFRVYCAIKSILGKKPFVRITYNTLKFRMCGFKSQKVFHLERCNDRLLTTRQLFTLVNKLTAMKLIDCITYRKRTKIYSTKYRGEQLNIIFINSIANKKIDKKLRQFRNKEIEKRIDNKVIELSEKIINATNYEEIKSKLKPVNLM